MIDDIMTELEERFEKARQALSRELSKIRTGRANPSILDRVRVEYYGTPTPLNQVAAVKAPEPRLLTVAPFDRTILGTIEKAIHASDLGLNPNSDGNIIRIPIPALTGERREELAKQARRLGEDARIAIRGARRDANDMLKSLQKDGDISEDEMHGGMADVQTSTDKAVASIDQMVEDKEKQILEV
ncbi:MAG: ribosome recycling factor [Deltaproteobacteria bacterium]|nr:MAG: ribosome recycling factor [Deltaproteobacteria bacterium]